MSRTDFKPGNMLYPVPAVMVSCQREGEKPNIITVAWAGTVCSDPAMVSISVRPERYSHAIIEETGEFVINLTTKDIVRATDYCGVRSGRDVDKYTNQLLSLQQMETDVQLNAAQARTDINVPEGADTSDDDIMDDKDF